jgi:hypothetical protein
MSWLYSRVLVEEYLGENFSDGEQSAPLSGNPIQQAYCAPDKMTVFSRLSRFGMTYKPLTESRGEELLTLYLAGFHAKTSQPQGGGLALMENEAECGEKWRGSFVKYSQDSCSWKTHQCSLLGDLDEFSETWPQWGLMRDGECWEQRTLEQTIRGTESGLLPTPTTQGLNGGSNSRKAAMARGTWPTPVCQDSRHAVTRHLNPKSHHWKSNLGEVVMSMEKPNIGGRLNPMWVEWLMGWPIGWTDLKPLETGKSHCVQQPPGDC